MGATALRPEASAAMSRPLQQPARTSDGRPQRSRGGTRHQVFLALLSLLTCVSITTSSIAVWTHEVALNTDRWVQVVGPIAAEPAVQEAVSSTVAHKVVLALDVQGRLEGMLTERLQPLAAPVASQIEQGIGRRLATAMASPEFQAAWLHANRLAHRQAMEILRGRSQVLYAQDDAVVLDVWPLVGMALGQLQAQGVIGADVALPDLSQGLPAGALDDLNAAFGGRIPASLGTVAIAPADGLLAAQQIVSVFDWITVALIAVSVLLVLATVWWSGRRRRAVVLVAFGAATGLVLTRFAIGGLESAIVSSIADAETGATIRGVLHAALADLFHFSGVVIAAGLIVAIMAYLAGRPAWLGLAASRARGANTAATVPWRRRDVERLGLAAIACIVVWIAAGPWLALLTVTLLGILEVGLQQLDAGTAEPPDPPR
jgi:hypothetical protein